MSGWTGGGQAWLCGQCWTWVLAGLASVIRVGRLANARGWVLGAAGRRNSSDSFAEEPVGRHSVEWLADPELGCPGGIQR